MRCRAPQRRGAAVLRRRHRRPVRRRRSRLGGCRARRLARRRRLRAAPAHRRERPRRRRRCEPAAGVGVHRHPAARGHRRRAGARGRGTGRTRGGRPAMPGSPSSACRRAGGARVSASRGARCSRPFRRRSSCTVAPVPVASRRASSSPATRGRSPRAADQLRRQSAPRSATLSAPCDTLQPTRAEKNSGLTQLA